MSEPNKVEYITGLRKFKPYPAYKESGVEWLGEIPAQWGTKRLKRIVQFRGGGTPTKENVEYWRGDIPWVSPKDMKVAIVVDTEDKITSQAVSESATNFVPAGSVLIVVRSGILIHSIPVALAGRDLTLNQDLKALVPRPELVPEYLVYLISGMQRQLLVEWKKEGATVESLELDLVANTPIPLPSAPEQRTIAAFLYRETSKIDALVAKKERLIELLEEKRTALVSRAVTRGLDPNVPMKHSGVEWLGKIPAHWKVRPLKRIASIKYGLGEPPLELANGLPFIRATNVMRGRIVDHDMQFVDPNDVPWNRDPVLRADDIIVVRSGAYTGDSSIVPVKYDGAIAGYDMVVRSHGCRARFLSWTLLSRYVLEAQIELDSMRAAQPHLNAEELGAVVLLIPPDSDQYEITAFLDHETAKIDALISKVREAIGRFTELRTALISAAVMGKIDVREGVA